MNVKLVT